MEKENGKKFHLSQKTFFLTYPHCNEEKQTIFNYCLVKFKPKVLIVVKELHQDDENFHFHVWMEFENRISTNNPRYFDEKNMRSTSEDNHLKNFRMFSSTVSY